MGKLEDVGHSTTRRIKGCGKIDGPQHDAGKFGSQVGLPATLGCFCGAQPGLSDEDVGEQRERQEDDDGGREAAATLVDVEPDVCQGAGQGRRQRQTEAPPRRHDQDSQQEHRAEGVVRSHSFEQVDEEDFGGDQHSGGGHAPLRRRCGGPQHQRQESVAKHWEMVVPNSEVE